MTSGALSMTSSEQRFEEMEKDLIQLAFIEMMEIQLVEMNAKDDVAIEIQAYLYSLIFNAEYSCWIRKRYNLIENDAKVLLLFVF